MEFAGTVASIFASHQKLATRWESGDSVTNIASVCRPEREGMIHVRKKKQAVAFGSPLHNHFTCHHAPNLSGWTLGVVLARSSGGEKARTAALITLGKGAATPEWMALLVRTQLGGRLGSA